MIYWYPWISPFIHAVEFSKSFLLKLNGPYYKIIFLAPLQEYELVVD